jgi:hypothetical protein
MATYSFINAVANSVGTGGQDVYTVPAGKKSVILGCAVTNTTGSLLPVQVRIIKADDTVLDLSVSETILGGAMRDFLSEKKLVMQSLDRLRIISAVDNSLDCVISIMEDVD